MRIGSILRTFTSLAFAAATTYAFLWPGLSLVRDLLDPALSGPGTPQHAIALHRDLSPRFESWARERIASGRAAHAPLHDVPTTEWPMFTAVFYLLATEELERAFTRGELDGDPRPKSYARGAIDAARDLILDPSHHTWVRTHWGDDYLHRENVFFRSLLIAGLTVHETLTGDGKSLSLLFDQVESLALELDRSELGVLDDYPGECYPIDVLAAIGIIRRADAVLGTDHSEFVARSARAFEGPLADELGLPRYRVELPSGAAVQPSRGIGNSWILIFAPELWPDRARVWYERYDRAFWRDHGWAAGFREFTDETPESEWTFEIDAGPVLDGLGTAASAFGVAAARRNGRFDHAYTLSAELSAAAWALPGGTLFWPRMFSHAADAPYLGEAAILYFLTVQPAEGVSIVRGGGLSGLVYAGLAIYLGVGALGLAIAIRRVRLLSSEKRSGRGSA
jgi:hypothetical protein